MFVLNMLKTTIVPETLRDLRDFCGEVKNSPIRVPQNVDPDRMACMPMDSSWKAAIADRWWFTGNLDNVRISSEASRLQYTKMLKLRDRLLLAGGEAACLPAADEDIDNILTYGQFWYGESVEKRCGRPCNPDEGTATRWRANKKNLRICTGYALSTDGMWRRHSWLVRVKGEKATIVEATPERRVAYYGFAMNTALCESFAEAKGGTV